MKFKNILFDFDDTLVDFYDAEKKAFYNLAQIQSSANSTGFRTF